MKTFSLNPCRSIFICAILFPIFLGDLLAQDNNDLYQAIRDRDFETAQGLVLSAGKCDEEAAKLVIDGRSKGDGEEFNLKNAPAIKFLDYCIKELGLDPNIQSSKDGWTTAMYATFYGQPETAQMIVRHKKFRPNVQDNEGWTAAMFAARYGQPETAQMIVRHKKFRPNVQDNEGWTAAMFAAKYGQPETAQMIVRHKKFRPNVQSNEGWTAVMHAARYGQPETAQMIVLHENFNPHLLTKTGKNFAMYAAYNYPPEKYETLRTLLFDLLGKGVMFEAIKNNKGHDVFNYLNEKKHFQLIKELKNALRGDADPESACTEDQLNSHLSIISPNQEITDINQVNQCLICLERKGLTFKAHPENAECGGICGDCHKEYMQDLLDSGALKNDFCCPSFNCKKPITISFMMAPHQAKKFSRDFPVTEVESVKKALRLNYQRLTAKIPGYVPCHDEKCLGFNIKKNSKKKDWFQCFLCKKERFLGDEKDDPGMSKLLAEGIQKGTHCQCPKCEIVIEKNGGCQHMTCKKCKHEFMMPSMQDFKKHCLFCNKKVTIPNVYDGRKIEEITCPHGNCGKKFNWDDAKTYQE